MSKQPRVTVRVNQTTAGVGEAGSVYVADDTGFLRQIATAGVVTILSDGDAEDSSSGASETGGDEDASSAEGDSNEEPKREARGTARKNKRSKTTGSDNAGGG